MDRWKRREVGRVREEEEKRRSEERKSQKKEDGGARNGRKVAKYCILFGPRAPEGRQVGSPKRRA